MSHTESNPTPRTLLALAVACAIQLPPSVALAEGGAASGRMLEEVIITAQKREQSILDVGISVAVANEEDIRQRRIVDVTDITLFTPNATVKEFVPGPDAYHHDKGRGPERLQRREQPGHRGLHRRGITELTGLCSVQISTTWSAWKCSRAHRARCTVATRPLVR